MTGFYMSAALALNGLKQVRSIRNTSSFALSIISFPFKVVIWLWNSMFHPACTDLILVNCNITLTSPILIPSSSWALTCPEYHSLNLRLGNCLTHPLIKWLVELCHITWNIVDTYAYIFKGFKNNCRHLTSKNIHND